MDGLFREPLIALFQSDSQLGLDCLQHLLIHREEVTDDDVATFAIALGLAQPQTVFERPLSPKPGGSSNARSSMARKKRAPQCAIGYRVAQPMRWISSVHIYLICYSTLLARPRRPQASPAPSVFARPLAEEMAAQFLRPGVLDQALRSGLFLSGVRRIGKKGEGDWTPTTRHPPSDSISKESASKCH